MPGMKMLRHPAILFMVVFAAFVVYVVASTSQLPDHVASHFNASGQADGWMPRSSVSRFALTMGCGLSFSMIAVFWLIRFLPARLMNLPNRDYWLVPERRQATYAVFSRYSFGLACITTAFVAGLHYLIIDANTRTPPAMSTTRMLVMTVLYLGSLGLWILSLTRRFKRT